MTPRDPTAMQAALATALSALDGLHREDQHDILALLDSRYAWTETRRYPAAKAEDDAPEPAEPPLNMLSRADLDLLLLVMHAHMRESCGPGGVCDIYDGLTALLSEQPATAEPPVTAVEEVAAALVRATGHYAIREHAHFAALRKALDARGLLKEPA